MTLLWLIAQLVFWCVVIVAIVGTAAAVILAPPYMLWRYVRSRTSHKEQHVRRRTVALPNMNTEPPAALLAQPIHLASTDPPAWRTRWTRRH